MTEAKVICPHCEKQIELYLKSFGASKDMDGNFKSTLDLRVKPVSPAPRFTVS